MKYNRITAKREREREGLRERQKLIQPKVNQKNVMNERRFGVIKINVYEEKIITHSICNLVLIDFSLPLVFS